MRRPFSASQHLNCLGAVSAGFEELYGGQHYKGMHDQAWKCAQV